LEGSIKEKIENLKEEVLETIYLQPIEQWSKEISDDWKRKISSHLGDLKSELLDEVDEDEELSRAIDEYISALEGQCVESVEKSINSASVILTDSVKNLPETKKQLLEILDANKSEDFEEQPKKKKRKSSKD